MQIQENDAWLENNLKLWLKGKPIPEKLQEPSSWVFCRTGKKQELNLHHEFYLHSPYNIEIEVRQWQGMQGLSSIEWLIVYGIGLGYYYQGVHSWLKENPRRRVIFIEDDPGVVRAFLSTNGAQEFLTDAQAELIYAEEDNYTDFIKDSLFREFHITSLASYEANKSQELRKISYTIQFWRNFQEVSLAELLLGGQAFFPNFYRNIYQLDSALDGSALFDRFKEIPAIICGAGPSLAKNIELLKTLKDRALIFAGGTAMNALNSYGLVPHFGCGLDPFPAQMSRIVSNIAFETPYFYCSRMNADAVELLHGPHLYLSSSPGYAIGAFVDSALGYTPLDIDQGANVINMSLSVAQKLGCKTILLVGLDLAYTDALSYAPGIKAHGAYDPKTRMMSKGASEELILTRDIDGKPTYTLMKWLRESTWYAAFAEKHPEITLLNCTEGGIGFEGIKSITLEEASKTYLKGTWDLDGMIMAGISRPEAKKKIPAERIQEVLNQLLQDLFICRDLLLEFQKKDPKAWLEKIPQKTALLEELQKQLEVISAYKHLLQRFDNVYVEYMHSELSVSQHSEAQSSLYGRLPYLLKMTLDNILRIELATYHKKVQQKNLSQRSMVLSPNPIEGLPSQKYKQKGSLKQFFDEEGHLTGESYYLEGVLDGPSTFFYSTGEKLAEVRYVQGKKEGEAFTWNKIGKPLSLRFFKEGLEEGNHLYYFENGSLKSSLNYKEGLLDGTITLYYPHGVIMRTAGFKKGKREGIDALFRSDGTPLMQAEYKDDLPIGFAKIWNANGVIEKEISYLAPGIVNTIHQYDEAGTLISASEKTDTYFDKVTKDSLHLKEVISGIGSVLEALMHSTKDQRSREAQKKIQEELVTLEKQVQDFQDKGSKLLQESGLEKGEEKEIIWQTPSSEKVLDTMLQEMITPMQESMLKLEWQLKKMVQNLKQNPKKKDSDDSKT